MFGNLIAQRKAQRKANTDSRDLYQHLVSQARSPCFYSAPFNVEDTVEGRFELILLHLFIIDFWFSRTDQHVLLRRALQELLITDIDRSLREMGVGDMSVGKQMKSVGAALLGRLQSYKLAFEQADDEQSTEIELIEIISRNIGGIANPTDAKALANYLILQMKSLAERNPLDWASGRLIFVTDVLDQCMAIEAVEQEKEA